MRSTYNGWCPRKERPNCRRSIERLLATDDLLTLEEIADKDSKRHFSYGLMIQARKMLKERDA